MQTRKLGYSLRLYVLLSLLFLVSSLVALYSVITIQYFIHGLDTITRQNMVDVARAVTLDENGYATLLDFHITDDWDKVPAVIKENIDEQPSRPYELKKYIIQPNIFTKPTKAYFVTQAVTADGKVCYVSRYSGPPNFESMIHFRKFTPTSKALFIGITVLLIFLTLLLIILRSVAHPVEALRDWAKNLSPKGLMQQPPVFRYNELNTLADLIRGSLLSVQETLEREQKFLRHASHELRTPIATISSNIELMKKIHPNPEPNEKRIIDRIDRASTTMRHLTETLLWLSREDSTDLPTQEIRLDLLLEQCHQDLQYLLQDKAVTVNIDTENATVLLPHVPAKILLDNLIRNAFQHTQEGEVNIYQRGTHVRICNREIDHDKSLNEELGFGLGLDLSRKLAERFKWRYHNDSQPQGHEARIDF
ncbi:Swarming motility regulation sensor protein RssA [Zhongshania aliphaticivorans]|uniref:histidine kinase n=1 Tax=Zhongshania aliphaticivorans TaxID=1470434 RepID=A0A5S9N8B6_9GAMM|nr:HAMP domain-containing sensor histidine kinase [Zhongshania aliphaticivorans]CAA0080557.1 Swarming motility regulation sensor protein RssA [Zhongshania aliphaticivorans]CAA0085579.1 Swarming motility regulation sensor protein RssA [Zhongshania aliphaticivorans]